MSSVRDIREGPADEYWERLRRLMGPEGLITYWYLGRGFNQEIDPDTMSLRSDMRNGDGGLMAAPLAIAAPETGGWRDRDVVPAPMTYALHVLDPATDVRAVRVTRETVRRGRKIGFSRSVITDADDPRRIIALTSGTGVALGAAPPGFRPVDLPPDLPEVELPPLHVVFGAHRDPDGWRLPGSQPDWPQRPPRSTLDRSTSHARPLPARPPPALPAPKYVAPSVQNLHLDRRMQQRCRSRIGRSIS